MSFTDRYGLTLTTTLMPNSGTTYIATGDFNGDNKPDLVTSCDVSRNCNDIGVILNTSK